MSRRVQRSCIQGATVHLVQGQGQPSTTHHHKVGRRVPRCGHCHNLGLPSDHRLRETAEPTSKLLCPVLLKTECRICGECGHTRTHCPMEQLRLRLEKSARADAHRRETALYKEKMRTIAAVSSSSSNKNNKFSVLDSDDEEEVVECKVAPMTTRIFVTTGVNQKRSWADISDDDDEDE